MLNKTRGVLRIGTSNIVLPGNKSSFPEAFHFKSRLNYYSSLFKSVEINSTFYKVPMFSTCEKWVQDVGKDFCFTIKLWKEITHAKDLQFNVTEIERFLERTASFGNKKGCLLLQFPGKITLEYFNKVEALLAMINQSEFSKGWEKAVEFRNPSWYTGEGYELMDEYGASMVLHDYSKAENEQLNKSARVIYLRFHGPKGDYKGSYSLDFLKSKTEQINAWIEKGRDVYVYFNNTAGDAFNNARTLQELNAGYFKKA